MYHAGARDTTQYFVPALTEDQKEREKIGAIARICANIGLFGIVVGIVPITNALAERTGSLLKAYQVLAAALVVIMWAFQMITVLFCREQVEGLRSEATNLRVRREAAKADSLEGGS